MNVRWLNDPLFLRVVLLFQHVSSFTMEVDIARNGMVEACLLSNQSTFLPLIGIIVKGWCDWISALDYVSLTPLWIWALDLRWRTIFKCLFPSCILIDGADTSLPAVDILLMNRISLHACSINLDSAPFLLLLTTSQNGPINTDWKKMLWKLPHAHVEGGTTYSYKLYSWYRITHYFPPSVKLLPAGNIHRVIDEKVSSGIVDSLPSVPYQAGAELFLVEEPHKLFTARCIYSTSKWQLRTLKLHELLRLKDCPDSIISCLSSRHRNTIWDWNGVPFRVLGLLLRFLIAPVKGTGGGGR